MSDSQIVLSGMRSTGKLHLGHLFGTLHNWVELQERHRCFFFAADWHALTSDYADPSRVTENTIEALADWIAAGIDPEKSVVFVQSMVPEHAELHLILSMITPLGWLERVPTYKDQIREVENRDLNTYGFLGYPVLQTSDIILYRANFVPVGEDQASHLELSREITRRFNSTLRRRLSGTARPVHQDPEGSWARRPQDVQVLRQRHQPLGPAGGRTPEVHADVHRPDPGDARAIPVIRRAAICSSSTSSSRHPTSRTRVERECRAATIGCVEDKKLLAEEIIALLEPIQKRRHELLRERGALLGLLRDGSVRARERARETMASVRGALGLDYDRLLQRELQ